MSSTRRQAAEARTGFDNDGFADLAISAPFESIGSIVTAGVLSVIHGSAALTRRRLEPSAGSKGMAVARQFGSVSGIPARTLRSGLGRASVIRGMDSSDSPVV
jgi:hypothetical protein